MKLPRFGRAGPRELDKTKIMDISMELMPVGVEFDNKIKEVLRKHNSKNPGETSEAALSILHAMINSIVGEDQTLHVLIEMLHRQHTIDAMHEAIPMDDAKKVIKEIESNFKGKNPSPQELNEFIEDVLEKKDMKEAESKDKEDRPSYMG